MRPRLALPRQRRHGIGICGVSLVFRADGRIRLKLPWDTFAYQLQIFVNELNSLTPAPWGASSTLRSKDGVREFCGDRSCRVGFFLGFSQGLFLFLGSALLLFRLLTPAFRLGFRSWSGHEGRSSRGKMVGNVTTKPSPGQKNPVFCPGQTIYTPACFYIAFTESAGIVSTSS